jgi:hypothetical protein
LIVTIGTIYMVMVCTARDLIFAVASKEAIVSSIAVD